MQDDLQVLIRSAGVSRLLASSRSGDRDIRPVARGLHFDFNTGIGELRLLFWYCKKSYVTDSEITACFSWELACCGDGGWPGRKKKGERELSNLQWHQRFNLRSLFLSTVLMLKARKFNKLVFCVVLFLFSPSPSLKSIKIYFDN